MSYSSLIGKSRLIERIEQVFEESKIYQDPDGNNYHLFTATNGVLTISKSKPGKGIVSMKGFDNLYQANLYLKGKRAEEVLA